MNFDESNYKQQALQNGREMFGLDLDTRTVQEIN